MAWSFPSIRSEVDAAVNKERTKRLVQTRFTFHQDPVAAARATISLRNAYPWMTPTLAAQMGAFGVDPADYEASELAGMSLARRYRRGWVDGGGTRNPREVRNVMARRSSTDLYGTVKPTLELGTRAAPTIDDATMESARRYADEAAGVTDFYGTDSGDYPQPMAGGIGGGLPMTVTEDQSRNLALDGVDPRVARQIAEYLPGMDATVRHLRRGGLTFQGIPLPGGEVSPQDVAPALTGPARDDIRDTLLAKRQQLEAQYEGLEGSSYPNLPDGMTPAMRAVYDGIVSALDDVIMPARQSIGPDIQVGGIGEFNIGDIEDTFQTGFQGAVRTATAAMDLLWQAGQARFRQGLNQDSGGSTFNSSFQAGLVGAGPADLAPDVTLGQTDLGIMLEHLARTGDWADTGSGFFISPTSEVGQTRLERERQHGLIGGHVITMGRFAADTLGLEPDTTPFDVVSGLVDLGWILAEPGGAVVDTVVRSSRLRRLTAHAGGFAATQSVDPARFDEYLRGDGAAAIRHLADLDPTDPEAIMRSWQSSSRSGQGSRMPRWAYYDLASGPQGSTQFVEELLRGYTGMGYQSPGVPLGYQSLGPLANLAPGIGFNRRLSQSRLAQQAPETGARALDVYDADGFVANLEASLRNARVADEDVARIVHRIYDEAYTYPSRVRVQQLERELAELPDEGPVVWRGEDTDAATARAEIEDTLAELRPGLFINRPTPNKNRLFEIWEEAQTLKRERLIEAGADPTLAVDRTTLSDVGRRVDKAMIDDTSNEGLYWLRLVTRDDGSQVADHVRPWAMVDGEHTSDLSSPSFAHVAAEHLARYLPLEDDYRQLARLTRSVPQEILNWPLQVTAHNRATGQLFAPWRGVDEVLMNRIWKPSRLLRPAWPLRVVGEEQFRIAATGFDSAISHPLSYLALVMGTRQDGRLSRLIDDAEIGVDLATGGRTSLTGFGSNTADALGTPWATVQEFTDAMNRAQRNWIIPTGGGSGGRFDPKAYINSNGQVTAGFVEAWTDLLARLHSDDITRRVAQIELGIDSQYASIDELIEAGGGAARSGDELRLAGPPPARDRPIESVRDVYDSVVPEGGVDPVRWHANGEPLDDVPFVYRWMSEQDWRRVQRQGFLDTSGEGVASGDKSRLYASIKPEDYFIGMDEGRLVRIRVEDSDGWVAEGFGRRRGDDGGWADTDLGSAYTRGTIPIDRVEAVSPRVSAHADPERDGLRLLLTATDDAPSGGLSTNIIARTRADLMDAGDSRMPLGQRGERTFAERYAAGDDRVLNWDDYVESIQVRLHEVTGRDPELMHTVARGRFSDGLTLDTPNTTRINRAAAKRLDKNFLDVAPGAISGDVAHYDRAVGNVATHVTEGYDRAMERMYALLGAIPTDRLSRSPAFRQFYARRMQELLPYMNADAQAQFLRNAEDLMGIPESAWHIRLSAYIGDADSVTTPTLQSLRAAAGRGTGDLDLEFADELAKHAALDNTRWLLYDVHRRGLFMDAMRIVFPFGEAWKEVATRWMQLLAQRPGTVTQRATQIVGAAGGQPEDWESVVDDPSQHGMIFTNSTGETVFTYPGSEWFTAATTGVPVEFTGSLNGLTMLNSVVPGLGPVIQVPLSTVDTFRDSPMFEGVREVLFPYGLGDDPTDSWGSAGMAVADAILSPAAQRFIVGAVTSVTGDALADDRLMLNSIFDVMRYRVSAGKGSTETKADIRRLVADSTRDAGFLYMIRGLAGMALPSAPIPEFQVESGGELLMLRALSDQYRQYQEEDWSTASQRFLADYGEQMALVIQSKTVPTTAMLPVTREADEWVQNNPGVMDEYPLTFGLWTPGNTGEDDFDFEAYNRYVRDRAVRTLGRELELSDLVYLANDRVASNIYRDTEAQLLAREDAVTESGNLTEEAQRYLSTEVRSDLRNRYPGFGSDGLERGPSSDDLRAAIGAPNESNAEVRRAVNDPRVPEPLREALRTYLEVHDEAMTVWAPEVGSTTYYESEGTASIRTYLRTVVYPGIRDDLPAGEMRDRWDIIWDRLFDRVMLEEGDAPTANDLGIAA